MSSYENSAAKASGYSLSLAGPTPSPEKGRFHWYPSPRSFVFELPRTSTDVSQTEAGSAEEITLLKHLIQGNGAAFWPLWEQHRNDLYAICLLQLGGNPTEAEDALSRAMLKAWNKLPAHAAQIKNLRAWLSRLTYNLCVDIHRERRPACKLECLDCVLAQERDPRSQNASPEEISTWREISAHLHHAIRRLPLRLREPFMLRFLYDVAYQEIAEQLALSPDNVRKRIQQARVLLRKQLRPHVATISGTSGRVTRWGG